MNNSGTRLGTRLVLCFLAAAALVPCLARVAAAQKKEYLTEEEADKIRDAAVSGPRIVLYTTFAADRIKKIQYELAHIDPNDRHWTERVNALLNGYGGCIDDADDLIDEGVEKQEDIRDGLKELRAHIKDFLTYLQSLAMSGPQRDGYKDNLEDAIEATQDAQDTLDRAEKESAPPPVRRKQ